MTPNTAEILNTVQPVLRHLMISIAAAAHVDLSLLGQLLAAASANAKLDPAARAMLADLAEGASTLGAAGQRKQ